MSLSVNVSPPIKVNLVGKLQNVDDLQKQWATIPFAANSKNVAEQAAETFALFDSPELSKPSLKANLSDSVKSSIIIQSIDNAFVSAMEEYRSSLIDATAQDFATSLQPRVTALDFHYALATGVLRLTSHTPDVPVIKHLVGPLLAFIGAVYGMINKKAIVKEKIALERSEARDKWLQEVLVKEQIRVDNGIKIIKRRVATLKANIDEAEDLIDMKWVDEIKVLNQFMQAFAPEETLRVGDILAIEYVDNFE